MKYIMVSLRSRLIWRTLSGTLLLFSLNVGHHVLAQPPKPSPQKPQSSESDLTRGLLDLLNEPTIEPEVASKATPVNPELKSEAVGQSPSNPLDSVRQSMLIAAKYLAEGSADPQTRELQGDIVLRLDQLIDQFQKSQDSSKSKLSQSEQQRQQSSEKTQTQSSSKASDSTNAEQTQDGDTAQNPNGNPGHAQPAASVTVDLADPEALQKSVWGHLPERLRMQMQARMVEQFLPSYREQIEAYFRALLEQEQ